MEKIKQKTYLKELRENLGRVEEKNDRVICYVDNQKLKKFEDQRWHHFVFSENKLDKPLYIVFEKVSFKPYKSIIIDSCDSVNFIFRECSFDGQIDIGYAENVLFENNHYFYNAPFTHFYYFFKGKIKNLKIKDDYFNMTELAEAVPYLFLLELDTLEINNTSMLLQNCNGEINMRSNKIDIINSNIKTNNSIKLLAKESNLINNKIESKREVVINGEVNGNLEGQLNTPILRHNGVNITEGVLENSKPKQLIKK